MIATAAALGACRPVAEPSRVVIGPTLEGTALEGPALEGPAPARTAAEARPPATGREQSPVDISNPTAATLQAIDFEYGSTRVSMVNEGRTIRAECESGGSIRVDGISYRLTELSFRAPSGHTVNGRAAAMEMHMLHRDARGGLAVIAVLIEEGSANEAFGPMWERLPPEAGQRADLEGEVNLQLLLPRSRRYYRYRGSLTAPPCTEGVTWLVMQDPIRLAGDQLDRFRAIHDNTARPVQPLNGRQVLAGQ